MDKRQISGAKKTVLLPINKQPGQNTGSITTSPQKDRTVDFLKQQLNMSKSKMQSKQFADPIRNSQSIEHTNFNLISEGLSNSRRSYENQMQVKPTHTYGSVNSSYDG